MMGIMVGGHAFLSYVREDRPAVEDLQRLLEGAGIRVWRDKDELWPGEDWQVRIRRAITDDALAFIACFSSHSVGRDETYQNKELNLAVEQFGRHGPDAVWLIPVRFDDCKIPDLHLGGNRMLSSIHSADLFGDDREENAQRLVAIVRRVLDGRQSRDTNSVTQIGPQINVGVTADPLAGDVRHSPSPDVTSASRWGELGSVMAMEAGALPRAGQDRSPTLFAEENVMRKTLPAGESKGLRPPSAAAKRRLLWVIGIAVAVVAITAGTIKFVWHPHHVALCRAAYPVTLEIPRKTGSLVGVTVGASCGFDPDRTYLVVEELPKVSPKTGAHPVYFVKDRLPHLAAGQAKSARFTLKEPVGTWAKFFIISVNNVELLALEQNQVPDHGILQLPNGTRKVSRISWHQKAWEGR